MKLFPVKDTQLSNRNTSMVQLFVPPVQVKSPGGPASRCSHQSVMTSQSGGQMWVFGGEYASPSETQFHHYKDLWCYHFGSRRWEKVR